jgi:chitinase
MLRSLVLAALVLLPLACSSSSSGGAADASTGGAAGKTSDGGENGGSSAASGASSGNGGRATNGGTSNGGSSGKASAGASNGGLPGGGGGASGSAGVSSTGGVSTGSGGASNGGASNGGASNGGASNGGASNGGAGGASASSQWVLGYYVGYQIDDYPIAQIDWTGLSHIAFAPMLVNADLSLSFDFDDSHGNGTQDAKALATAAHAHGVKALLMLGGAGAGPHIATAAGASHRAAFVSTLTSALSTLGYDGIDLDWEDSVNLDDLVSLAAALRAAQPTILLTYPAGAINGNVTPQADARMAALAKSLDQFNVQTYGPSTMLAGSGWSSWFSSPVSGAMGSTPTSIEDSFQRYVKAGVPKAKLGMGIEFSATCYTGGITGPRQPTDGSSQRITGGDNAYPLTSFYATGSTFDKSSAGERKLDAVTKEPYLSLGSPVNDSHCGASTQYLVYEDETSIQAKGAWARANGYGGIIVWTIQQGYLPASASGGRARNALMQALKSGFLD